VLLAVKQGGGGGGGGGARGGGGGGGGGVPTECSRNWKVLCLSDSDLSDLFTKDGFTIDPSLWLLDQGLNLWSKHTILAKPE
jgi:hypothetical protein